MQITFNGEPRQLAAETSIADLLQSLDMRSNYVAVEVNGEIIPRTRHAEHLLREGDRVEAVTLVGGG